LLPSFAAARPQIAYFTLDVFTVVVWQEWASQLLNTYTRTKNVLNLLWKKEKYQTAEIVII